MALQLTIGACAARRVNEPKNRKQLASQDLLIIKQDPRLTASEFINVQVYGLLFCPLTSSGFVFKLKPTVVGIP